MESGYDTPAGELVERVLDAGAVGMNIEDTVHSQGRLREVAEHADYIGAIRAAADQAGVELVINARTDAFIGRVVTFDDPLAEAVRRLRACEDGRCPQRLPGARARRRHTARAAGRAERPRQHHRAPGPRCAVGLLRRTARRGCPVVSPSGRCSCRRSPTRSPSWSPPGSGRCSGDRPAPGAPTPAFCAQNVELGTPTARCVRRTRERPPNCSRRPLFCGSLTSMPAPVRLPPRSAGRAPSVRTTA